MRSTQQSETFGRRDTVCVPRATTLKNLGHFIIMVPTLALFLIATLAAGEVLMARAEAQEVSEYQVKAAFLYNFTKFVQWPADVFSDEKSPIIIGLIGEDPFGSALDRAVRGKSVRGRQLTVKRLKWGENLKDCHLIFIGSSERKRAAQILKILKGASVLTVGEMEHFNQQGGIINFISENQRVRFEINADAAGQARLTISSKLLSLARNVHGGQRTVRN